MVYIRSLLSEPELVIAESNLVHVIIHAQQTSHLRGCQSLQGKVYKLFSTFYQVRDSDVADASSLRRRREKVAVRDYWYFSCLGNLLLEHRNILIDTGRGNIDLNMKYLMSPNY